MEPWELHISYATSCKMGGITLDKGADRVDAHGAVDIQLVGTTVRIPCLTLRSALWTAHD